jgi:hypothetical protein
VRYALQPVWVCAEAQGVKAAVSRESPIQMLGGLCVRQPQTPGSCARCWAWRAGADHLLAGSQRGCGANEGLRHLCESSHHKALWLILGTAGPLGRVCLSRARGIRIAFEIRIALHCEGSVTHVVLHAVTMNVQVMNVTPPVQSKFAPIARLLPWYQMPPTSTSS